LFLKNAFILILSNLVKYMDRKNQRCIYSSVLTHYKPSTIITNRSPLVNNFPASLLLYIRYKTPSSLWIEKLCKSTIVFCKRRYKRRTFRPQYIACNTDTYDAEAFTIYNMIEILWLLYVNVVRMIKKQLSKYHSWWNFFPLKCSSSLLLQLFC